MRLHFYFHPDSGELGNQLGWRKSWRKYLPDFFRVVQRIGEVEQARDSEEFTHPLSGMEVISKKQFLDWLNQFKNIQLYLLTNAVETQLLDHPKLSTPDVDFPYCVIEFEDGGLIVVSTSEELVDKWLADYRPDLIE